jgi:hypothetical protein
MRKIEGIKVEKGEKKKECVWLEREQGKLMIKSKVHPN